MAVWTIVEITDRTRMIAVETVRVGSDERLDAGDGEEGGDSEVFH